MVSEIPAIFVNVITRKGKCAFKRFTQDDTFFPLYPVQIKIAGNCLLASHVLTT